jgi:hypothetical protein
MIMMTVCSYDPEILGEELMEQVLEAQIQPV